MCKYRATYRATYVYFIIVFIIVACCRILPYALWNMIGSEISQSENSTEITYLEKL